MSEEAVNPETLLTRSETMKYVLKKLAVKGLPTFLIPPILALPISIYLNESYIISLFYPAILIIAFGTVSPIVLIAVGTVMGYGNLIEGVASNAYTLNIKPSYLQDVVMETRFRYLKATTLSIPIGLYWALMSAILTMMGF